MRSAAHSKTTGTINAGLFVKSSLFNCSGLEINRFFAYVRVSNKKLDKEMARSFVFPKQS